jgi:hypothetical protein
MVGAAIKGLSKILRKELRKSPVLGKYVKTGKKPVRRSKEYEEALKGRPRGTPTKAGLVHKRNLLRGDEPATKSARDTYLSRRATLAGVKGATKPKSKNILLGTSALAGAAGYIAGKKGIEDRKSTKSNKDKLKKSLEKHKKKTKEQKEKQKK